MKSNEAPEKIYMPNELLSEEWQRHIEGEDTEYTRTDAFIDKACEWWENELSYPSMTQEEIRWYKNKINAFRRAMMKG